MTTPPPPSPDELDRSDMERLQAGHDSALNDLMQRHKVRLFHYLLRLLQNEEDAEDISQETFVRIYQNRGRFDSRQRFSTWLYAIATNAVKSRYRWRSRHPEVSLNAESSDADASLEDVLPDVTPLPHESIENEEQVALIRQAVSQLPEKLRMPLLLVEYENLSYAEAGEVLDCSAKAVDNRLARARQFLRERLGKLMAAP